MFFMDLFALEAKGLLRIYHDKTGTMQFTPTTECAECGLDKVEEDLICDTGSPYCVLCCECCEKNEMCGEPDCEQCNTCYCKLCCGEGHCGCKKCNEPCDCDGEEVEYK